MLNLSLKGLWAHKRRLIGTFLAVFLGVAFLSGTLVLGDTLRGNFDNLFTEANAGTDVVVRHTSNLTNDPGEPDTQHGLIDASLVDSVRGVKGVAAAEPSVEGFGQLVGKNGDKLGGNGPPTLAGNWIDNRDLNPYRLVEGRAPRADNEVVINRGAASDGSLHVGDTTTVQTPQSVPVKIVGIATFGSADGLGQVTFTAFTLEGAQQHLLSRSDQVGSVSVKAESGVSQEDLLRRVQRVLPNDVEAITGAKLTSENTNDINQQFLDLFTTFLTVFAGVALLVATFSIYNTFSIIVTQRTRESALMRAIGASRGQILTSVILEALLVGIVASAAGLFGGLGIAGLLKGMFDAFGFSLPAGGLVFKTSVVVISMIVGVVVTLVAGVFPAVKSSRIPPLAALRDVAVERTTASMTRAITGLALSALGVAVVLVAVTSGGSNVLPFAGLGALLTTVGVVVFGPVVAKPVSGILGAPLAKLRGITGVLARQNAMRNPRRTSGTAAALMVGVGVVTLFTVFAASLKTSIDESVTGSFRGDLVITTGRFGGGGISPQMASDIGGLPEVGTATGLGTGRALVDGSTESLTVANPRQLGDLVTSDVMSGSLDRLGDQQVAVSASTADDKNWRVGTKVPVAFADGTSTNFTVGAIYDARDILGDYLLTRGAWQPHAVQDIDTTVLIKLKDGVSLPAGKAAVEKVDKAYGAPTVEDRQGYADELTSGVNMLLGIVYVMLALAIVIALMGIGNTLALAIHERTRELGLLRAVGQTRRQVRSMIRWESVIVALFGTVGGLGLGVFLGWALVQAASGAAGGPFASVSAFSAPPAQLLVVLVAGAIAGIVAGFRPARRAARLRLLSAIASE
jgi:putative ABC transport system permease protein